MKISRVRFILAIITLNLLEVSFILIVIINTLFTIP